MDKEFIIFEAAKKIFVKNGFNSTTINMIAAEANVATAAVHYYFRSKENIYKNVVEFILLELINLKITDDAIMFFLNEILFDNSRFYQVLKNSNICENCPQKVIEILNDNFEQLLKKRISF